MINIRSPERPSAQRNWTETTNCHARQSSQGRRHVRCRAVKARWCIDVRYGVKMEAIALVQEWIESIGNAAGLSPHNTNLSSGAIGVPESRIEVEVEFDDLARVEAFWAALPAAEHQAWSQRARNFIIDGTPRWEVYRTCRTFSSPQAEAVSSSSTGFPTSASSAADAIIEAWRDQEGMLPPGRDRSHERNAQWKARKAVEEIDYGLPKPEDYPTDLIYTDTEELRKAREQGKKIVLDWKGDPMIINPGDNMPLF